MTVLIVDDDPLFCRSMQRLVPGETRCAATIRLGLLDAQLWQPAVILLDRLFEGDDCDGIGAIGGFQAASPRSKLFVVSADRGPDHVARAIENGASGCLEKTAIARILQAIVAARSLVASSFSAGGSSSLH